MNSDTTPAIYFPPFYPLQNGSVKHQDHVRAMSLCSHGLSTLLRTSPDCFAACLRHAVQRNLFNFIATYLRYRQRRHASPSHRSLDKKTFFLLYRISMMIQDGDPDVTETVRGNFDPLIIFDFCKWYGHMEDTSRSIVHAIVSIPTIKESVLAMIARCTAWILSVSRTHGKKSLKGKGKLRETVADDEFMNIERGIATTSDFCLTLMMTFSVLPGDVHAETDYRSLMAALCDFYDRSFPALIRRYRIAIEGRNASKSMQSSEIPVTPVFSTAAHQKQLKMGMLNLIETLIDSFFFLPITSEHRSDVEADPSALFSLIHSLIDSCNGSDKSPVYIYEDAPLLLDLEHDYSILSKLKSVLERIGDKNGAREELQSLFQDLSDTLDKAVTRISESKALGTSKPSLSDAVVRSMQNMSLSNDTAAEASAQHGSLMAQIQDLMPGLGDGFVYRCLAYYDDDVEKVIAALLDDNLPEELRSLDRSMGREELTQKELRRQGRMSCDEYARTGGQTASTASLRSRSLPPNYDDALKVSGPVEIALEPATAELRDKILFSQYDDEYDDTYDGEPASVPNQWLSTIARKDLDQERKLFLAFESNRGVFGRSSTVKRSKERAELKQKTHMTDEQIEGWAIMLERNPKVYGILKQKFEQWNEDEVPEDYMESAGEDFETSCSSSKTTPAGRGGGRGRGKITHHERERQYRKKQRAKKLPQL